MEDDRNAPFAQLLGHWKNFPVRKVNIKNGDIEGGGCQCRKPLCDARGGDHDGSVFFQN